ncbi:MAG TPA: leucyl aminopeptidase family protein [Spirochaetota bacterium]|jgi:leucyl aminopeptidase|nr:MAG: Cytosol aminopeptidase [Spirochaetes bacterium ADurb.Bin133]HNZ27109.1 leucyl aminopeptidase family protein [Spirochaetota bacterium]HPY88498.1 leucyl aminopeptidase family protein [Spirochaetota bacterium]
MKFYYSNQSKNRLVVIPFCEDWELEDFQIINNYLPIDDEAYRSIYQIREFISSFGSVKKIFLNSNEYVFINIGKKEDINIETLRKYASLALGLAKSSFNSDFDVVLICKEFSIDLNDAVYSVIESLYLSDYTFEQFKSKNNRFKINSVSIISNQNIDNFRKIVDKAKIVSDSIYLARDLINSPANVVTIDYIEKIAKELAQSNSLEIKVFDNSSLLENGMNLIAAVGSGGPKPPRLIELIYNPPKFSKTVCLVGKGIVFDTGGVNLKPGNFMDDMKSDMAGAATTLAIIDSASKARLPVRIIGLIPLAENSVDANSYRTSDIIKSYKGKYVEIKNTDAEGRLILADALSYSDTKNPDVTIDFATLTGAAVVALGSKMVAGFFGDEELKKELLSAARFTNETIWELPLFEDYKEYLKSDVADLANIGNPAKEAGSIIGALFLQNFIDNKKWAHLDIAGPAYIAKDDFYFTKGATGVMIRTVLKYLENLR